MISRFTQLAGASQLWEVKLSVKPDLMSKPHQNQDAPGMSFKDGPCQRATRTNLKRLLLANDGKVHILHSNCGRLKFIKHIKMYLFMILKKL